MMISKIKIDKGIIENLTDEQLDDLVYTKAADLHLGTFGESFKNNEEDEVLRLIFSTTVLDNEVKNGGFDSFFTNNGDLQDWALRGLRLIGANGHADVLEQAIKINKNDKGKFRDKRNINLNPLDEQYWTLDEVSSLRQRFVREQIQKFVD